MGTDTAAELAACEQERCRAISECDWPALEGLLASDYSHTHSSAVVQDTSTYLEFVKGKPRATSRGTLHVRVYGDAAVMSGRQFNTLEGAASPIEAEVIQVWVRAGQEWRLAAFQSTRVPAKD